MNRFPISIATEDGSREISEKRIMELFSIMQDDIREYRRDTGEFPDVVIMNRFTKIAIEQFFNGRRIDSVTGCTVGINSEIDESEFIFGKKPYKEK